MKEGGAIERGETRGQRERKDLPAPNTENRGIGDRVGGTPRQSNLPKLSMMHIARHSKSREHCPSAALDAPFLMMAPFFLSFFSQLSPLPLCLPYLPLHMPACCCCCCCHRCCYCCCCCCCSCCCCCCCCLFFFCPCSCPYARKTTLDDRPFQLSRHTDIKTSLQQSLVKDSW